MYYIQCRVTKFCLFVVVFRKDAQSSIVVGGDMASTDKAVAKKVEERNRTVTATAKTVTETRAESAAARSKQVKFEMSFKSSSTSFLFWRDITDVFVQTLL